MKYKPSFLSWSFGDLPEVSAVRAKCADFQFSFLPTLERKRYHFAEEVSAACQRINALRQGKTIALCASGGFDSEIIAREFNRLAIPFELYFLNIWDINWDLFETYARPLAQELKKPIHLVPLSKLDFYENISLREFRRYGCELPTYLAMTHLFRQIPENQFIVTGEGSLSPGTAPTAASFSYANVFYYLWAEENKRDGEFYFFQSTAELFAAMISNPLFPETRSIAEGAFPGIKPRPHRNNWDGEARQENKNIRIWLEKNAPLFPELAFWRAGEKASVDLRKIFIGS